MRKNVYTLSFFLFFLTAGFFSFAQPVVDGDLSDGDYQTLTLFDQANNGFGNLNNLGSIRFYADFTDIYIGIPADLSDNNNLVLFLDFPSYGGTPKGSPVGAFGANGIFGQDGFRDNSGEGGTAMDFEVDYAFAYNEGFTNDAIFVDGARYGGGGLLESAYFGSVLGKSADQSGNPQLIPSGSGTFIVTNGMELAYDSGGSISGKGIEHRISIASLGGVTPAEIPNMRIFALIANAGGFCSNEFLPLRGYIFGNPKEDFKFNELIIFGQDPDLFVSPSTDIVTGAPMGPTIFEPEGLNMPGSYNGFGNPPFNNPVFLANSKGGEIRVITTGLRRYQTRFRAAASGGDVVGGSYPWLFTSGPDNNPFQNKWNEVNVVMNELQEYTFNTFGGVDNQVTFTNDRWYTMNFRDNGYNNTQAVFMESSEEPTKIAGVKGEFAGDGQDLPLTVVLTDPPAPEEKVLIRYTTNGFSSSTVIELSCNGTECTGTIPGSDVADTENHQFYALTTTAAASNVNDFTADMYTINLNNNEGANYLMGQVPIPTLSEWGLFLFALIMLNLGLVFMYNQRGVMGME